MQWYEIVIVGLLSLLGVYVGSKLASKQLKNQLEYNRITNWIRDVIKAYSAFSTNYNTVLTIGTRQEGSTEFDQQMYKENLAKVEYHESRLKLMFSASIDEHKKFLHSLNEIDSFTKELDEVYFINKSLATNIQNRLNTLYADLGIYFINERNRISNLIETKDSIMRSFISSIPNKIKALYLLWSLIHSVFFLIGGIFFEYNREFWPFEYNWIEKVNTITFNPYHIYDFSELLIYVLVPIVIYTVIKLWNKKDVQESNN